MDSTQTARQGGAPVMGTTKDERTWGNDGEYYRYPLTIRFIK